jgi:hypothetical protein
MGQHRVFPRVGTAAHGFVPGVEGTARRQARPQRADLAALVRLATPGNLLDLFGPQQQAPAGAGRIERQGEQAGPLAQACARRFRPLVHAAVQQQVVSFGRQRGDDVLAGGLVDAETDDAPELGRDHRLRLARRHQFLAVLDQRFERVFLEQQRLDQAGAHLGGAVGQRRLVIRFDALHGRADYLCQHVGRHADRIRHAFRAHVVAGEQPPQAAVDHDRHAHRCRHAHVLQIFHVDRRHAAQHAEAQVERRRAGCAQQGHRVVGHVGDHAQRVQRIQAARLRRDVAGRIALPLIGHEVVAARLGHHVAAVVAAETVSHHAVEAGELAHLAHGGAQQAVDAFLAAQALDRTMRLDREQGDGIAAFFARLEFDDDAALVRMHHAVVFSVADDHRRHQRRSAAVVHGVVGLMDQLSHRFRCAELLVATPERERRAQPYVRVGAPALDGTVAVEEE